MRCRIVRTPIAALAIGSLCLAAAACGQAPAAPASGPIARTLSASGDAAAGTLVFENAGGCAACHATTTDQLAGPGRAGRAPRSSRRPGCAAVARARSAACRAAGPMMPRWPSSPATSF